MKLKDQIRAFLGIDSIPSTVMFQAMEKAQRERHADLINMLTRIETRMIAAHIDQPREFSAPVMDWDTVTALAAHRLENEPEPKEN